jgi:iron complex outermembrane recepter protein
MKKKPIFLSVFFTLLLNSPFINFTLAEPTNDQLPQDLTELDIRKLMDLDLVVTSPGKKEQTLSNVASAVYVISKNDIQRSGATHLAEVLRGAPGVTVARIAANRWAVSIRGFNQLFNNKLLVLIDGISVFSPTTNGVYWEALNIPLSTIERIEIVRGPGGVLWGSNAVNGIINIITKSSNVDQGTIVSLGGGTHEHGFGEVSQTAKLNDTSSYRTYASFRNHGPNESVNNESSLDNWQDGTAGIRYDSQLTENDNLTFSGDVSQQWENVQVGVPSQTPPFVDNDTFSDDASWKSAKGLIKWNHKLAATSDIETKFSIVHKDRNQSFVNFDYQAYTLESQHHFQPFAQHDVVYGASYRFFQNSSEGSYGHVVSPSDRNTNLVTAFLQDEITLIEDLLELTLGAKLEENSQTGLEFMPNARLLLTPTNKISFWGAVSRAVAPPALFFEDSSIPVAAFPLPDAPILGVVQVDGNRSLESESLIAYELGARSSLTQDFYLDVAGFYNKHDDIFGQEPGIPHVGTFPGTNTPGLIIPYNFSNTLKGSSYGAEMTINWKTSDWLSLISSYTYIQTDIDLNNGQDINNKNLYEGGTPINQYSLKSIINLSENWSFDNNLRYIDLVPYKQASSYFELDSRLAWQANKSLEFSLVGQNLLHDDHVEFESNLFGPPRTAIERAFYGMVTWKM